MNYLKILVPVVAVLVIGESVVLLSGIGKKGTGSVVPKTGDVSLLPSGTPDASLTNADVDFGVGFNIAQNQMQVGKPSLVSVNLLAKKTKSLDSLNLYVKYDPRSFDIANLTFDSKLPKPTFSKVSTTRGMVVVNFLISEAAGMNINQGDSLTLVNFEATPKTVGDFSFEISTGNGTNESATMFVENATAKALPYSGSILTVKAIK